MHGIEEDQLAIWAKRRLAQGITEVPLRPGNVRAIELLMQDMQRQTAAHHLLRNGFMGWPACLFWSRDNALGWMEAPEHATAPILMARQPRDEGRGGIKRQSA